MMPMIRVDDEVYQHLNDRGKTEDTFNDVLRRILGLEAKRRRSGERTPQERKARTTQTRSVPPNEMAELWSVIEKHLPPRLSNAVHRRQIEKLVVSFLEAPADWTTKDREISAARQVANEEGVTRETIQDGGTRRLGLDIEEFRRRLEAIEVEYQQLST